MVRFSFVTPLLMICAVGAFAQTSTGDISITVVDPTNALVPNATITIKGSETGNIVRSLKTNGDGLATAPLLLPGNYDVVASAPGFKLSSQPHIAVNIGETTNLHISLVTGGIDQTVTVSGSAPLIQDKTSNLTQVISSRQMLQVPLNGRSYLTVANLSPGAIPTVGAKDSSFLAYGNSGLQNAFLLDGARNVSYLRGLDNLQRDVVRPPLDALSEFSVQTSNYSSEYGNSAGAVVNANTKNGTDELHGSAYEFLENSAMDAPNFFALSGQKPLLVYNQYGGSIGAPIKRNRAWVFGAFERLNSHADQVSESSVPSLANRAGNFGSTPIYDPATTTPVGTGYSRSLFPNNTIPTSRFSSITSQLLNSYPVPNVPGSTTLFVYNGPQIATTNNGVGRVDVQLTSRDSMFVRGSMDWLTLLASSPLPLPINTPVLRSTESNGVGFGYTRVFSATLVNEVRFAWTGIDNTANATQALNPIIPGSLSAGVTSSIPQFTISGYPTIGAQPSCCNNTPVQKSVGVWDFSDNLSMMVSKHVLKFGGEVVLIRPSTASALNGRGVFGFTGVFTQNPQSRGGSGSALADFLLGTANSLATGTTLQVVEREWYGGAYFQDDWTVTDGMTLNLGIRYDYISPSTETHNQIANFIETPGDPNFGSYVLAGDPRYPRSLVTSSALDIAPRVGFAYHLPHIQKLVLRGSFGIFFAQDSALGISTRLTANPPFYSYGGLNIVSDQINPSSGFEVIPGASISTPAPISPSQFKLSPASTTSLVSWADHMTTPYVEEWNLTVERQFPWKVAWSTSYVGNVDRHMWNTAQGNQPLTNGPGSPNTRRPLAGYTVASISQIAPWGSGNYNGVSAKLEKQWEGGVSFLTSFTYGRAINLQDASWNLCPGTNGSGCGGGGDTVQNAYNRMAQKGPSDNDATVRYSLGGEWAFPFGPKTGHLNTGWEAAVTGGWALAAIYQFQTGLPFTPILSSDNANAGTTSWPNRVCNGNASHPQLRAWFNTSCFVVPPPYQFGNTGRNVLWGPHTNNLDLSLHREFHLPINELSALQLRAEAFNSLNHPQFAQPGSTLGTPSFGVVTATLQNNRILQLGVHIAF